jgi:hypothetical protein
MIKVASGVSGPITPRALGAAGSEGDDDDEDDDEPDAGGDGEPSAKQPRLMSRAGGGGKAAVPKPMGALMSAVAARGLQVEWKEGSLALRLPPSRAPQVWPGVRGGLPAEAAQA